ncbi:MAG TPA: chemotaxis protein CheW [Roseiflexaceae bacterium]|nr:chemotaxis protein CheW [Roseiflexaceae bacterium]
MRLRTTTTDQTVDLVVTWRIGRQLYGMPVGDVLEVVRVPAMLTLAGAPPHVCGLLNRRGEYIPVLDGRVLLEEPPRYDLASQVVLIGNPLAVTPLQPYLGLLVDQVCDVQMVASRRMVALNREAARPILRGVIDGDESILLLDTAALIALAPALDKAREG